MIPNTIVVCDPALSVKRAYIRAAELCEETGYYHFTDYNDVSHCMSVYRTGYKTEEDYWEAVDKDIAARRHSVKLPLFLMAEDFLSKHSVGGRFPDGSSAELFQGVVGQLYWINACVVDDAGPILSDMVFVEISQLQDAMRIELVDGQPSDETGENSGEAFEVRGTITRAQFNELLALMFSGVNI